MSTSPVQIEPHQFGLYFLLSRFMPGLALLSVVAIFLPGDFIGEPVLLPATIIAVLLSFPAGQLVYSIAVNVEQLRSDEEYHRSEFERIVFERDGEQISDVLVDRFVTVFSHVYDIQPSDLAANDVYRITRSAIEIDNRGRSLQWDALQSFSRSMKYTMVLAVLIVLSSQVVGTVIEPLYTPIALSLTGIQKLLMVSIAAATSVVFHYGERFYKQGYLKYLITDFCNLHSGIELPEKTQR